MYDPKKSGDWKKKAALLMKAAMKGKPPLDEPLSLDVVFRYAQKPHAYRTKRPDLDNLLKAVMDAGNGILWADDSCVAQIYASKIGGVSDPSVMITVEPVDIVLGALI